MVPNFVVIGAPKSGTTSLYYYLTQHPDIYLPERKELHYFSYDQLRENANGPGDGEILSSLCGSRDDYLRHFEGVSGEMAIGDISPSYLYYGAHAKIRDELGAAKIIVLLRNPIEKAYSQFMHMVRDQREDLLFYDALMAESSRREKGWSDIWRYAESSLYAERLQAFIDFFGRDHVHIVVFDDFENSTDLSVRGILRFLEIDDTVFIDTSGRYNRTGASKSNLLAKFLNRSSPLKSFVKVVTPDRWRIALRLKIVDLNTAEKNAIDGRSRAYLQNYFSADILALESMLGRKLNWE